MEKEKQTKTGDVKMITPPTGRSMSTQFLGKSWLTSLNTPPNPPYFVLLSMALHGISLVSSGHLSGCAPSQPAAHTCLFTAELWAEGEREKALMLCKLSQQSLKLSVFGLSKHP